MPFQKSNSVLQSSPAVLTLMTMMVTFCLWTSFTLAQAPTTTAPNTTTSSPTPPSGGTTTTASPGGTSGLLTFFGEASIVDLIFSFFAEDSDSINSYAVTIAQHLNVPARRIDFYNVQPGDTTNVLDRTPSNTPFGPNTMARVTVQPGFVPTSSTEANPELSVSVRDRLVAAVKRGDVALTGIFIIDANPINSKEIYSYSVRTVFDLMYTFIIATMGVAYLGFIGFVIYKLVESHQHAKIDRLNRQKEKEERKMRREAMRRAGKVAADMEEDEDDENEQIDASRFDEFGGDGDDDEGQGDYIKDEDGSAIRNIAMNVAGMIEEGDGGIRFSPGSRRSAGGIDNSRRIRELENLVLPPVGGVIRKRSAVDDDNL